MSLSVRTDTSFDPSTFEQVDAWLAIMRHPLMVHINDYVSVSRLKAFEQCPQKFWFGYVAHYPRGENEAADFGKFCHAVLEEVYKWIVATEFEGIVPEEQVTATFRRVWEAGALRGPELYAEGLRIIRAHFDRFPTASHWDILGIEFPFEIEIGGRMVKGYIDRLDKIDHETIEVIDYKSNRQMFEREELEIDIQVSTYDIAVRQLFPWVKKVKFRFDMLRHGKDQFTERTEEEREIAAGYIASTANQTEVEARPWPAKLGFLCNYCDHRERCDDYRAALADGPGHDDRVDVSVENLILVSRERERLHNMNKVIEGRVKELDKTLKAKCGADGDLEVGEYTYRMITVNKASYAVEDLVPILAKHCDKSEAEILKAITKLDKKSADALIAEIKSQWEGTGSRALRANFAMNISLCTSDEFWFSKLDSRLNKNALRAPSHSTPELGAGDATPKALPAPQALTCDFCQAKGAKLVERGGVRFAVCEEHKNKRKAPAKE